MTARGLVTLDLQAAQSPGYRERGVARHSMEFVSALVARHPSIIDQILLDPSLPPPAGFERLVGAVPINTEPVWKPGGIFHVLSPFELTVPLRRLWPPEASRARKRLVVTVYDLIPEIFEDIYLIDGGVRRRWRARRELVRGAHHVTAISQSAAADVVRLLGLPAERVTAIGSAASDKFQPAPDRTQAGVEARALVDGLSPRFVVYNGAVEPRKNMELLVRAFARLPSRVRDVWQLVLVCRLRPLERHHYDAVARHLGIEGRLLQTGYLPDETLVRLYQSADLVVFPSLYEGFGLPVAEAIGCGAPVIASGNSALLELVSNEATFDPNDVDAIAAAMQRGLTDESYRARLTAWSSRRQATWGDVADRAVDVYERVAADDGATGLARRGHWRRRALVAVVTPWPPARSGVANYSQRLVAALGRHVDVDLYVDGDQPVSGCRQTSPVGRDPALLPARDHACGGYDAVLLCLGNSEFHAGALRLLRVVGQRAIVLAHDARMAQLYLHGEARGAVPEGWSSALASTYPELSIRPEGMEDPAVLVKERGLLFAREVAGRADQLLLTSGFAADLVRLDARPEDRDKIGVCSFAYPPVVAAPADARERSLICSFGIVHPVKCPDLVLRAFATLAASDADANLAFVGPVSVSLREDLHAQAAALGVAERVTVTGFVPPEEYDGWLRRATVAVQLRADTSGETSAAVADCLAYGVTTVVNPLGAAAELPDFVAKVELSATALSDLLAGLVADPSGRDRRAAEAHSYVASHGFDQAAAELVSLIAGLWSAPSPRS